MKKVTVVINGVGGCGKDTLIEELHDYYNVRNVSSITPIKEIAKIIGWKGTKDDKSRKFLSDLKALTTEFNEYPLRYILNEQEQFLSSDEDIMFVHIREPEEIEKFVMNSNGKTLTLLVRPRAELQNKVFGNHSDDDVENYNYDLVFDNDKSIEETKEVWLKFVEKNICANIKRLDK